MGHLFIFGRGYSGSRLARKMLGRGWTVTGSRSAAWPQDPDLDDTAAVLRMLGQATHILSSVPPGEDGRDPVLDRYREALGAAPALWIGYLSSTGVYGDTGGAWVDETAPLRPGRAVPRARAEAGWRGLDRPVAVFRLPGIYGPGRSAVDRARRGAEVVEAPLHVFSRIHVDDIVSALALAMDRGAAGIFNVADDLPASGAAVMRHAYGLIGRTPPDAVPLASAALAPAGRRFYAEHRRVANGKIKRSLGLVLRYPDYRSGLRACLVEERS